jgi:hypothetical protein
MTRIGELGFWGGTCRALTRVYFHRPEQDGKPGTEPSIDSMQPCLVGQGALLVSSRRVQNGFARARGVTGRGGGGSWERRAPIMDSTRAVGLEVA